MRGNISLSPAKGVDAGATDAIPQDYPFPLLFAESLPLEYLSSVASFDITQKLADLLGPLGPSGSRDKVLILSNPHDPHADVVGVELVRRGAKVCRFNTEDLLNDCRLSIRLGESDGVLGRLELPAADLRLDEIRSVWFRRPEPPVLNTTDGDVAGFVARESEATLRSLFKVLDHAFWVSDPDAIKDSDRKLGQLKLAQSLGLRIPRTLVTNDPRQLEPFYESCNGQVIIKTFQGWIGSSLCETRGVCTNRVLFEHLAHADLIRNSPCLFQEYVPKEVELRVTVIGRRVFAVEIHSQRSKISEVDWRRYDIENTPYLACDLPDDVECACLSILEHYRLAFGAIDLIRTPEGEYVFLEINGNGQWLWIQELTGLPMASEMAEMLMRGTLS